MKPFDISLKKIKELHYLPWIGKDYGKGKKLLIVGESDYRRCDEDYENENHTRDVVKNNVEDNIDGQGPLFTGIQKAIFGHKEIANDNKLKLWNSCAFFNLSQEIVENSRQRPKWDAINNGWDLFFKIIGVIKPDFCIILSLSIATYIDKGDLQTDGELPINGFSYKKGSWKRDYKPIGGYKPARLVMEDSEKYKLPIIFIRHPSKFFDWENWSEFVKKEMKHFGFSLPF